MLIQRRGCIVPVRTRSGFRGRGGGTAADRIFEVFFLNGLLKRIQERWDSVPHQTNFKPGELDEHLDAVDAAYHWTVQEVKTSNLPAADFIRALRRHPLGTRMINVRSPSGHAQYLPNHLLYRLKKDLGVR